MSHSSGEVILGGVVLAAALAFGVYAVGSTGLAQSNAGYPVHASFRSAEGVSVGTDVRLAGVKVGTVTGLMLNGETYRADATMTLRDGVQIPDDSAIVVASEGLLGGNFIEISPGASTFYLESGDEVYDTQGSVSLMTLLMRFVSGQEE